ncbi:hypothetical protein BELL_0364g00020 [Botrytis elliptica]|uniref:Major facilitator superfamily (MFS) profile domain-containing protein n=1 Tax=Botrytis elliptica TaxID=278938 RepID=A0A4Z1JIJ8_9HELO|nr:hypothetical protein BELL_0364g00020 [Botrytis elliptica]
MHAEKKNNSNHTISAPPSANHTTTPSNCFPEKPPPELYIPDNKRHNNDIDPEQAQPAARPEIEAPPNGGYGWVYALRREYFSPVLLIETNTFPRVSNVNFAFMGGLFLSMAQFIAPIATITMGEWGTRTTLTIGIILQNTTLLSVSWSTEIWQLVLSQGVCFGFGMGMQFCATFGMIPQCFDRRRSLENGIGTAESGIGRLIDSLASRALSQR